MEHSFSELLNKAIVVPTLPPETNTFFYTFKLSNTANIGVIPEDKQKQALRNRIKLYNQLSSIRDN